MSAAFQIVLHAHLPFIRHPENPYHLEENWLFEAISETYLPLIEILERLADEGVATPLTISLSQTLIAMLDDELLRARFIEHLDRLIELAESETRRLDGDEDFEHLAHYYLNKFRAQRVQFVEHLDQDVVGALDRRAQNSALELITCVGTHGFLPLMEHDESRRAQILTASREFEARFGRKSAGMWMGECAYWYGVEAWLAEAGVKYSFVDAHGVERAPTPPTFNVYQPVESPRGVAFFGRDPESSAQVWSAEMGYPGDYDYREFYRDVGFDLDEDYIGPYIHPDGIRIHTGLKYYRITTREDEDKKPYRPEIAAEKAREHARHFVQSRQRQLDGLEHLSADSPMIVTCPYDAELYGHWWYEGPLFLEEVFRAAHEWGAALVTPSTYLDAAAGQLATSPPAVSSWGAEGFFKVWLNGDSAWIYPLLHDMETCLVDQAAKHPEPDAKTRRALDQMARELMLAQASDWAFIIGTDTSVGYAKVATERHTRRFWRIFDAFAGQSEDVIAVLEELESDTPIFDTIDYRDWAPV